jgi:hypothetical protein
MDDETLWGDRWPSVNHTPAAATAAVATKAAAAGKRHQCTGITLSATAAPAAAVEATLQVGAVVVERFKIPVVAHLPIVVNFDPPYTGNDNEAVTLTLPSYGGAVIGSATIRGRSLNV